MKKFFDFIKTGKLNGIALGSSALMIRKYLGKPPLYTVNLKRPKIYKYGNIEFHFCYNEKQRRSTVFLICIEFSYTAEFSDGILPKDWIPDEKTTINQCRKYLTASGLDFNLQYDQHEFVHYQAGLAVFHFRVSRNRSYLYAISVSIPVPVQQCPCPAPDRRPENGG